MITLQNLINLATFSDEMKAELLEKIDSFTDSKKRELINMCWDLISQWYHNEVRHRYNQALLEMTEGKKIYTEEELAKIPDIILAEFKGKLEEAATEEDIQEIREKLTYITAEKAND